MLEYYSIFFYTPLLMNSLPFGCSRLHCSHLIVGLNARLKVLAVLTAQNAGLNKLYCYTCISEMTTGYDATPLRRLKYPLLQSTAPNAEETAQFIQDAWRNGRVVSILKSPTDCFIEILWKMGLPAEIAKIVTRRDTKAHHQYNVTPN